MQTDEESIINQLSKVGIIARDIYDLVNSPKPYPEAIAVLVTAVHNGIRTRQLKEGVIRALAVKEARGKANQVLIQEFYKTPVEDELIRWVIGNTFEVIITTDDVPAVIDLVLNRQNGMSRQMFVLALAKVPSDEVNKVLISLLDDDELVAHATAALGKMKSEQAKEKIVSLLSHPKPFVRKEATKALKKIG